MLDLNPLSFNAMILNNCLWPLRQSLEGKWTSTRSPRPHKTGNFRLRTLQINSGSSFILVCQLREAEKNDLFVEKGRLAFGEMNGAQNDDNDNDDDDDDDDDKDDDDVGNDNDHET